MEKEKKEYVVPEIEVVKLERQANLLEGSPEPEEYPINFNGDN